jgi:hypothetical protein
MSTRSRIITLGILLTLVAGCGAPVSPSPAAVQPSDTPESTQAPPTDTPTPQDTPTPTLTPTETLTPTPVEPMVQPDGKDISCYFGPGLDYAIDGGLLLGEKVPVLGRDSLTLWLQIENPRIPGKNRMCWVPIEKVITEGDIQSAPIVKAPVSLVTSVIVNVKPSKKKLNPCVFPYTFDVEFTIQVTGPVTVTFQRSLSDGHTAPAESVTFKKAGTKTFSDYMRVGSTGDHWFMVTVTYPNATSGTGYGTVTCP